MRTLALVFLLSAAVGPAAADDGGLIYPSEGKLWLRNDDGRGDRQQLAAIPGGKDVDSIAIDYRGQVALLRIGESWHRLPLRPGAKSVALDCKGDARLSGNGRCVVCIDTRGKPVVWVFGKGGRGKRYQLPEASVVGFAGGKLLLERTGKLVRTALGSKKRELVSPHAPASRFLASPNGKRAIGYYPGSKEQDNKDEGLYSFRLDGRAVKRRLLRNGTPVVWSLDSRWVVIGLDDQACLLAAIGGQYKCWSDYQASTVTADGKRIFLRRKRDDSKAIDIYAAATKG
ncbi:MAG: hypothetical protein KJO07_16425, partial [Deltaproteobacteria bacterium]|nr:hypothetical protein [Deltaproteobacteria bacterium]